MFTVTQLALDANKTKTRHKTKLTTKRWQKQNLQKPHLLLTMYKVDPFVTSIICTFSHDQQQKRGKDSNLKPRNGAVVRVQDETGQWTRLRCPVPAIWTVDQHADSITYRLQSKRRGTSSHVHFTVKASAAYKQLSMMYNITVKASADYKTTLHDVQNHCEGISNL